LLNRDTDAVVKAGTFANVSGKGFQMKLSRRNLLKAALGMPAAAWLLNYRAAAVLDMIHPDVAYSGGMPCSLIRFYASMHMGAATQNFFKVENASGAFSGNKEKMAQGPEPAVRKSMFPVPGGPGLGLDLNEDWLRAHMASGDAWWG
jgi:hypothetical protein